MYMYTVYCNDICTYEHVHVVMYHDVVNDSYNIALLFRYIHFNVNLQYIHMYNMYSYMYNMYINRTIFYYI